MLLSDEKKTVQKFSGMKLVDVEAPNGRMELNRDS